MSFKNKSQKYNFILKAVFIALFFQTGLIVVFAFIDARWTSKMFLMSKLFGGLYTDFNADWFNDAGVFLLTTYKVQVMFPMVEFFLRSTVRTVKRCFDQRKCWPNDVNRSRAPTINKFVELYLGQQFWVHYKYSTILNLVFVAFFFGAIMPVMFPLCFVGLCVMYIVETLMMYYSYRKPAMFDDKMTHQVILALYYGPVAFVGVGAWAFQNQMIYANKVLILETSNVYPANSFRFMNFFNQLTPATPLVLFFVVFIAFRVIKGTWPYILNQLFCIMPARDVDKMIEEVEIKTYSRS
jgi:hypothetical protein